MAPVHGKISAAPVAPPPDLKVFRPQNPYVALGLAANHLMTKPAFANLRFGDWSRILVGQINRKHYCFAVDSKQQIQGFMGWALTSKENAEAWVEGRGALSFADSLDGDCVVFNAWAANTGKVNRFLLGEARKVIAGKDTVYFKRFYKGGSVRPARLRVNDFVAQHLRRPNDDARALHRTNRCTGDRPVMELGS
jgi:hemolysin-activating ACP:hemolysin acyltransferase